VKNNGQWRSRKEREREREKRLNNTFLLFSSRITTLSHTVTYYRETG
jgi:hypothetical protein